MFRQMRRRFEQRILRQHDVLECKGLVHPNGALAVEGWPRSIRTGSSVDSTGLPIPWISYPMIDLLGRNLPCDVRVFEFGSGNSTLWWASRASQVRSVEHDRSWYEKILPGIPGNVHLEHRELEYGGSYSLACQESGLEFDVVMVDGRDRVNCMLRSCDRLSARGILVLDNSDRDEYAPGVVQMRERGFRRLDLWGMAPIIDYKTCTSVFYKDGNVLGL